MNKLTRRDFLKMSVVGAAGIAGASLLKQRPPKKRKKKMIKWMALSNSGLKSALSTYEHDHENVIDAPFQGIVVCISILGAGSVSSIRATFSFPVVYRDLTFVREDHNGSYRSEIWYLLSTLTGTYTIEPTFSGSVNSILFADTYAYFGGIDANGGANGTGTPASKALTTIQDNSMVMAVLATQTTSGVLHAAGQYNLGDVPSASGTGMAARTDIVSPPASKTLQFDGITAGHSWAVSAVGLLTYVANPPAIMG